MSAWPAQHSDLAEPGHRVTHVRMIREVDERTANCTIEMAGERREELFLLSLQSGATGPSSIRSCDPTSIRKEPIFDTQ
jgi:hypothetical protein